MLIDKNNQTDKSRHWTLIKLRLKTPQESIFKYPSEAIAHCMCKEMPVIPVNKVVDRKE
jgi:hypothetical protein